MINSKALNERVILNTLRTQPPVTMERLVTLLPHMTWNCVFQAIDALSRTGKIRIRRRGFDYELGVTLSSSACMPLHGPAARPVMQKNGPSPEDRYYSHATGGALAESGRPRKRV